MSEIAEATVTIVKIKGTGAGKDSVTVVPAHTYEKMVKDSVKGDKEILNWKVIKDSRSAGEVFAKEQPKVKSPEEIEAEALAELKANEDANANKGDAYINWIAELKDLAKGLTPAKLKKFEANDFKPAFELGATPEEAFEEYQNK